MKDAPLEVLGAYGARIDALAKSFLARNEYAMYGMMQYFMGYTDEHFNPTDARVGKRVRPGLLLLIADGYGAVQDAIPAGLSIELFHNFTLIHDDIEDHDELRRGRPTVWKLWGVNHAINTGDAQLILSMRALEEFSDLSSEIRDKVRSYLLARYLEVIEGQFLDFSLATASLHDPAVSKEAYLTMIRQKTAVLVRAATEVAAMIAKRSEDERSALGDFGENLGMAYQLFDDWQGVWGLPEQTGKKRAGDIFEHKKTLPALFAYKNLGGAEQARLEEIYTSEEVTDPMVAEVLELFRVSGAQQALEREAALYKERAVQALGRARVPEDVRALLVRATEALVPDFVTASR